MTDSNTHKSLLDSPRSFAVATVLAIILATGIYSEGLAALVDRWNTEDEYGHGYLLAALAVFYIYSKWHDIVNCPFNKNYLGIAIIALSSLIYLTGEISSLHILIHYSYILTLYGFFVCLFGLSVTPLILPAIILLAFSIPLPYFLQTELTISLQLISSQIGVYIINALSIPVFLEGNQIDLGTMKLQVVEACAGLRYLFSLLSFSAICAYIFRAEVWKRLLVLFSAIPITVAMNSFRIATTGVLVHHSGIEAAEGFIHTFQGMVIFSLCLAIIFIEIWILTKVGKKSSVRDAFYFSIDCNTDFEKPHFVFPAKTYAACITLLILCFAANAKLTFRNEIIPDRQPFAHFPSQIKSWSGNSLKMNNQVIQKLKLSDYISSDYFQIGSHVPVNFYVAYYDSQRKGASPHSPRVCIPAGGWEISNISREDSTLESSSRPFRYNRAIIQKGKNKQLVYYWFQQRGRTIANEYHMKWYLFKDSVTRNRTDGALVRLVTPILPGEEISAADQRLSEFANDISVDLDRFIPI